MNVGLYIHSDSKLGSIVVIKNGDNQIAKDIAMHVSAFNPLCLSSEEIDKDILAREKKIYENFICVIFHTGNLPKHRGGSPIQNLILKTKRLFQMIIYKKYYSEVKYYDWLNNTI